MVVSCMYCRRKLKNKESIIRGCGLRCYEKNKSKKEKEVDIRKWLD